MRRTAWLQELRMTRFEEAFFGWTESRLTQAEAARVLGVCPRTFRRWSDRYEEAGLDGVRDKRLTQASRRAAPVDEVLALVDRYRTGHRGWTVKHFYTWYRREGGGRSYTWVKTRLQAAGGAPEAARGGPVAGDAAAPGRESARVGAGAGMGSDCHDGRCDQ